jgi:chaperone modulatory protein CbpM
MSDRTHDNLRGVVLDSRTTFTLTEFCRVCGVERSLVVEMVSEGVIEPMVAGDTWHFHGEALVRAKRGLRLVRDLHVNWPGAALALDLLDQLEMLHQERRS